MNVTLLNAPVAGPSPCGDDLSFSTEFDAIQEMRRADDPSLDQGEWVTELKVADWSGVAKACEDLLATRTKDLRVAGWLVEAWARLRGFAGLHDGIKLTSALIEQHWADIHPLPDDGDQEQRIGNLSWLLHRVEELSRQIPLATATPAGFCLSDLEAARVAVASGTLAPQPPNAKAAHENAPRSLSVIQRTVSGLGLEAFERQKASMDEGLRELTRLQGLLDERLGNRGPAFGPARRALEAAREAWLRLGRDCGLTSAAAPVVGTSPAGVSDGSADASVDTLTVPAQTALKVASFDNPTTRAHALQQLRHIADYFRRTEPHSPVAYLADQAARWGDMPLHAWLRSVMKDGAALAHLEELLGTTSPPDLPA